MKYGLITCSYMGRIYGDNKPETLDWGDMTRRHLAETGDDTLMSIARTARQMGLENIELWWGHSDYHTHGESEAMELAEKLAAEGIYVPAYTIGSWSEKDMDDMAAAYAYARGLGARVVVGALDGTNPGPMLERMALLTDRYGIPFAIENHPEPNLGYFDDLYACCQPYPWAIGLNLDTGIAANMGYDVTQLAASLGGTLIHVHAKPSRPDAEFPVDFASLGEYLRQAGFGGMVSMESNSLQEPTEIFQDILAKLGPCSLR